MKTKTISQILGVLAIFVYFLISVNGAYTSAKIYAFDIGNFTFDSDTYVTVVNTTANLTSAQNITFRGSFNAQKTDIATSTDVYAKLIFNNITLFDEKVRTLENLKDRGAITIPIVNHSASIGENNIIIQLRDTGAGGVLVSDFHLQGQTDETVSGGKIRQSIGNTTTYTYNTSYLNVLNITLDKDVSSKTSIDIKSTLNSSDIATITCYAECYNTSDRTPYFQRYMSSSSDIGSAGLFYVSNTSTTGAEEWGLYCKGSNTETIQYHVHYFLFELGDSSGNIINSAQGGNSSTNITSSIILSAGTGILSNTSLTIQNGTEPVLEGMFIAQSTSSAQEGSDSPQFYFYNTVANTCSLNYDRSFSSNADIGDIKLYSHCQNTTVGNTYGYQLRVDVQTGETLRILDESFSTYEALVQTVTTGNIPPIASMTNPDENDTVSGNLYLTANVDDLNNDTLETNITLIDGVTYQVVNNSNATSFYQLVDTGYYPDGNYMLNLTTCETNTTELYCTNILRNFTIQNAINVGGGSSEGYKEFIEEQRRVSTPEPEPINYFFENISEIMLGLISTLIITVVVFPKNAKLKLKKTIMFYLLIAIALSLVVSIKELGLGLSLILSVVSSSIVSLVLFARNGNLKLKRFIIYQLVYILIILLVKYIILK